MSIKKEWFEKEAGTWSLGLILIIAFIGSKIAIYRIHFNVIWDSLWFTIIILSALTADIFNNAKSWTYNSFQIIEDETTSKEERIRMIQSQLEIAVDRYMAVFLLVNGLDTMLKKVSACASKIFKGKITIKELIVILAYAIYNLVLIDLPFELGMWDEIILFFGIAAIKIVDANAGVAGLIAEMYFEAKTVTNTDKSLLKIRDRIIALMNIYHIETIK